ncbi:vitellogenin-2-like [Macadamia integrifolia]|uniref:vitellogenin-2-like n=1 Tax=Macadamia integrifolia TaxID=60698 RepID=UPI001C501078|nr:vitellogenin-2-like [Macadamia integrifolia]
MATETMRIRARNKFLLCFRPVAMNETLISEGELCSGDQVFDYISVADKKGVSMISTTLPSSQLPEKDQESSKFSANDKSSSRRPKKNARRIFSALMNAAFFESKLKRKLRNRKVRQDPCRPDGSQVVKTDKLPYVIRFPKSSDFEDMNTDSAVSSSLSSSSSSSTSTFISRSSTSSDSSSTGRSLSGLNWENSIHWNSSEEEQSDRSIRSIQSNLQERRQKSKKKRTGFGFYSSYYGLLLILISIFLVIFSGRFYAILCTSTLFYLAPRQVHPITHFPEDMELKRPITETPEYKKKVIMTGLLGRRHC